MTDREMLELAAKAVGKTISWAVDYTGSCASTDGMMPYDDATGDEWHPILDDGDALRLAVKLNMSCAFGPVRVQACTIEGSLRGAFFQENRIEHDQYAATRRAIVSAAAEIGRSME